jgi:zinc protease
VATALRRGLTPARTVLDNGAVVLVQETSTIPAVSVMATFLAGSLYDPAGSPGLAYLTGRLLDRGTERRSGEIIAEELDDRGVSLKVSTSRHTMALSCTCLAEDFDQIIGIVLDVARRPVFPEAEIAKRRSEIITALRQDEDNPAVRATEALLDLLYGTNHPYGRRSKGTVSSIERIERADLIALHGARIRPGTLTLTVVGDVPPDRALERAARELEGWNGAEPDDVVVPPPPPADGRRVAVTPMPGKSQTDIAYGFSTIRRLDPRYYAYWLMNNILGQFGLGGRLADNIRERQGMAYYAFSGIEPSVGEGPLIIRAGVDPANVERAVKAIDHEVGQLAAEGPTPGELEESRQYLIGSVARMLETNQSIAAFLQNVEQFDLGLDYDQRLQGRLEAVTIEDVRSAAVETLDPGRAAVAIAGPS